MATNPTPPLVTLPQPLQDLQQALSHVSLSISIDIPPVTAILELAKVFRDSQLPEIRNGFDAIHLDWSRRMYAIVIKAYDAAGLPAPVVLPVMEAPK